ncbi:unnamed protein product, partial [Ectocarpus fasciculatus]
MLGRGNYLDGISDYTGMGESTVNQMFHKFTARFAREFYPIWVKMPDEEDLKDIMTAYGSNEVGMSGAMGSMDVTHLHWAVAPYS